MAATYAPADAFYFSKTMIKNMPLDTIQVRLLDDVSKIIWMAAPWRWTLGSLGTVNLSDNTQDYTLAIPSDYLYATQLYITNGLDAPRDLAIVGALPTNVGQIGQPGYATLTGTPGQNGILRVYPKPGDITGTQSVYGTYKKTSPVITVQNSYTGGTLVMDDEWFWVYEAGVLWLSYLYGDDSRAGGGSAEARASQVSGQKAIFESGLQQMKEREKLPIMNNPGDARNQKDTSK